MLDEVTSPEIAEALAITSAITLAREEGLDRIILVSDCLSIIQKIHSSSVDDIKIIATSLSSVSFRHVSCSCDNSAHDLARRAEQFGSALFRDTVVDFICDKLRIDVI